METKHGGSLQSGKRKTKRPLAYDVPIHLVLKATNSGLLLRNSEIIQSTLIEFSKKHQIKIFSVGIQADHIHLHLKIPSRECYVKWIRAITSALVQKIRTLKWKLRPFTRISAWGREFRTVLSYVKRNHTEGQRIHSALIMVETWRAQILNKILACNYARPG